MKIVIEVNDDQITRCVSTDEILRYFANELRVSNQGLWKYIFSEGVSEGWFEADKQYHNHCGCNDCSC